MDKYSLLDCTLRDGGYITNWHFTECAIKDMIQSLIDANMDFIEVGYLNISSNDCETTQFSSIEAIEKYIPQDRENSMLLAMADVQQFMPEDVSAYTGKSIEGIRIVFYKHQIEEAMMLAKAVKEKGYKLFMQPMVTIDYTIDDN